MGGSVHAKCTDASDGEMIASITEGIFRRG